MEAICPVAVEWFKEANIAHCWCFKLTYLSKQLYKMVGSEYEHISRKNVMFLNNYCSNEYHFLLLEMKLLYGSRCVLVVVVTLFVVSASSFACMINMCISFTYCFTSVGTGLQHASTPWASLKVTTKL